MARKINFKPNDVVEKCPKCGNNTAFTIHSQQVAEDYCNVWAVCKCGYDATAEDTGNRIEDV
jgi:DNA-directed RNA polymerase subunit M/transcription elongation factor TFIIS